MLKVHIHRAGASASPASKAFAVVLVVVGIACVVLLLLGLWILLAVAFTTMAIVALVRTMLPRRGTRERVGEGPVVIEGQSTTVHDLEDARGKEGS
jgi:membrane protein implicated in regulation of membrane protease activity